MALLDLVQKLRCPVKQLGTQPTSARSGQLDQPAVAGIGLPLALQRQSPNYVLDKERRFDFAAWVSERAWRSPLERLPFTPLLACEPPESVLMSRFDWQFVPVSGRVQVTEHPPFYFDCGRLEELPLRAGCCRGADPRTVWAAPHLVHELLDVAEAQFDERRADRVVVFTGSEMPLSVAFGTTDAERRALVARLRRYFGTILYQTKDVQLEHVQLAPMGLCWLYMMKLIGAWLGKRSRTRLAHRFAGLDAALRVGLAAKTRVMLASWGEMAHFLDQNKTMERTVLAMYRGDLLSGACNSSLAAIAFAWESRRQLRQWAATPAAREVPVEVRPIPQLEWWTELGTYKFILSPMGSGIQTSKTFEALTVLTVPVIQRMNYTLHDELVDLGFPIALVDSWEEITHERVAKWWDDLAPRLESFRSNCLTVDGYWRIYTGQFGFCA